MNVLEIDMEQILHRLLGMTRVTPLKFNYAVGGALPFMEREEFHTHAGAWVNEYSVENVNEKTLLNEGEV